MYRVIICRYDEDAIQSDHWWFDADEPKPLPWEKRDFADYHSAHDWAWEQLQRETHWADRVSAMILCDGKLLTQVIASERVGMFDRASERYTLPKELRR